MNTQGKQTVDDHKCFLPFVSMEILITFLRDVKFDRIVHRRDKI